MLDISLRSNFKELERTLDKAANDQLPFAMARAITELAKEVKDAQKKAIPEVFDNPTPFTVNSVRSTSASKRSLTAKVFVMDKAAEYLLPYETGGHNKLNSKALLKPIGIQTNKYGNIPRNLVQRLVSKDNVFAGPVKFKSGTVNGIWERSKRGTRRTGQRGTKGSLIKQNGGYSSLKLLIKFDDAHTTQASFDYFGRAKEIIDERFDDVFSAEMKKALDSAK